MTKLGNEQAQATNVFGSMFSRFAGALLTGVTILWSYTVGLSLISYPLLPEGSASAVYFYSFEMFVLTSPQPKT